MKKNMRIFMLVLIMIISNVTICSANGQIVTEQVESIMNLPSHSEKVEHYNCNKESLNKNTDELLRQVLNYGLLVDIYAYDNTYDGIMAVSQQYDALKELLLRDDLEKTLLKFYENVDVKYNSNDNGRSLQVIQNVIQKVKNGAISTIDEKSEQIYKKSSVEFKKIATIDILENLLIQPKYIGQLTDEEKNKLVLVVDKKWKEKENSNLFKTDRNQIFHSAVKNRVKVILNKSKVFKTATNEKQIKTPKGSTVTVICNAYWGDKKSNTITNEFVKKYPSALLLSKATNCYNCHSYALVSASSHNIFWLNNPLPYLSDKSYVLVGNYPTAKQQKALWFTNGILWEHSGIVDAYSGGVVRFVSKWGQGPLMKHSTKDCPYQGDTIKYYKKKY